MEEISNVLLKNNEKKKKRKSMWLCGLKVISILNFDVLVGWEFDFLDLCMFNFVLMWI